MKRSLLILFIVAAGAVVASCSNPEVAATVNDTAITFDDIADVRTAPVEQVAVGEQVRQDLTTLIVTQATVDAAEEQYGITGLDTDEGRQEYMSQASQTEQDVVASIGNNPELGSGALDAVITQIAVRSAVVDELYRDEAILERVWQTQQQLLLEVCVRHVLVETESEAADVLERIRAGEDISDLADEVSLDPSPGGVLPCPANPIDYVEPFATIVASAQVGEPTGPFQTEFGWHVVVVDSREFPESYEAFVAEAERWLPVVVIQGAWANWRDAALGAADIAVRSQIGTWFPQADGILPPPDSP